MDNVYTFDKKKKLAGRIKKLTQRFDFEQVKKIIMENNPELESMKNQNGLFLAFNNLTNDTYVKLANYLDKMEKQNLKKIRDQILETSEILSEEETIANTSEKNMSKKLRLTNTEAHIINRVKYEKELKKNENMSDTDNMNIYNPDITHKKKIIETKEKNDIFVALNDDEKNKSKTRKINKNK